MSPMKLACKKKFPRINVQYSARFSPDEYKYESHFFPSRPDVRKRYDKVLKIKKKLFTGCVYAEVNQ